jgi:ubiquinol-cytochrome c reductase iron-sulfur subunit
MHSLRLRASLTTTVRNLGGIAERNAPTSITPAGVKFMVHAVPPKPVDFTSNALLQGGFVKKSQNKQKTSILTNSVFASRNPYRHSTPLVQHSVRYYAKDLNLPEPILRTVLNAPKTSYGGDNITDYLKPQPQTEEEASSHDNREFAYLVNSGTRFVWSAGIRLLAFKFLHSISASAEVLALATIEVDVSKVDPGKTITITWRGKPVFIKHRTAQEIEEIRNTPLTELKDPQRDEERVKDEHWSVLLAICTHLGCVPVTDAGAYNAFFCPCHGSHYDASGRIRRGPAPLNLEVPKHNFIEGGKVIVLG